MDEPDGFITVVTRVKPCETLGELKAAVAVEVINNLYFGTRRLENNADRLSDLGIGAGSRITNCPLPLSEIPSNTRVTTPEVSSNARIAPTTSLKKPSVMPPKFNLQPLSSNRLVVLLFGILSMIRMPKARQDLNGSHTLFSNGFRPALVNILNLLDPISFVKFASTCRRISTLVRAPRNGVRIKFYCYLVRSDHGTRLKWYKNGEGKRTISSGMLKSMQKYPFHFKIDVYFRHFQENFIESVTNFIEKFKSYSLLSLDIKEGNGNWHDLSFINQPSWHTIASFLNRFAVKRFAYSGLLNPEAFSVMTSASIETLSCYGAVDFRSLLRVPQKVLIIHNSRLTANDMKLLIREMAFGKLDHVLRWIFLECAGQIVNRNLERSSFFDDFEIVDANYEGPLPTFRPLVCHSDNKQFVVNVNDIVFELYLAGDVLLIDGHPNINEETPIPFHGILENSN